MGWDGIHIHLTICLIESPFSSVISQLCGANGHILFPVFLFLDEGFTRQSIHQSEGGTAFSSLLRYVSKIKTSICREIQRLEE
jgi:hypothetical protein